MKGYLFFAAMCLFSHVAEGEVYQWVDKTGQVHFGNVPPHQQTKYSLGDDFKRTSDEEASADAAKQSAPTVTENSLSTPQANERSSAKQPAKKQLSDLKNPQTKKPVEANMPLNKAGSAKKLSEKKLKSVIQELRKHEKALPKLTTTGDTQVKTLQPVGESKHNDLQEKNAKTKMTATQAALDKKTTKAKKKKKSKKETAKTKPVGDAKAAALVVKKAKPTKAKPNKAKSSQAKNVQGSAKRSSAPGLASKKPGKPVSKPTSKSTSKSLSQQKNVSEKDGEKCGIFVNFVEQYKEKVREGCPGAHCDIYSQQLQKYQLKAKRYCR